MWSDEKIWHECSRLQSMQQNMYQIACRVLHEETSKCDVNNQGCTHWLIRLHVGSWINETEFLTWKVKAAHNEYCVGSWDCKNCLKGCWWWNVCCDWTSVNWWSQYVGGERPYWRKHGRFCFCPTANLAQLAEESLSKRALQNVGWPAS